MREVSFQRFQSVNYSSSWSILLLYESLNISRQCASIVACPSDLATSCQSLRITLREGILLLYELLRIFAAPLRRRFTARPLLLFEAELLNSHTLLYESLSKLASWLAQ